MKRAFSVCFQELTDQEQSVIDDESIWHDVEKEQTDGMNSPVSQSVKERLQCFTHTLQLTVGDGLKKTKGVSQALTKCNKLCTQLHSSTAMKEEFEEKFGKKTSIPAANVTRWSSTYKQVLAVLQLSMMKVNDIVRAKQPNLLFTPREWSQLHELVVILSPFAQATEQTQSEKTVSISMVCPSIVSLYRHVCAQVESARFLSELATTLRDSLFRSFRG